jgi:serine/threonine protein kinase
MTLQIASQTEPIPGYRLLERIGSGGFGEVWKAEAPGGLLKAVKVIHGDLRSADADGSRHAEQELRAMQRVQAIRHPYLLSLERYDVVDGRLLIVMELADCNLWDRFRECRSQGLPGIPRNELLRYMEEASEVLDLMNNQYQLQHLDIKPQNLFLVHNHVKVADFGLVKDLEGLRATITGGVTPVYAAPETFDGVVTRFCDQYSLAIVYQELLTGARPFHGNNVQQLLVQHLQGAPNLAPLPLSDRPTVARGLAKKPEERFPSCLHFVRSLYQASGDPFGGNATSGNYTGLRSETPLGTWNTLPPLPPMNAPAQLVSAAPPQETPKTELRMRMGDAAVVSNESPMPVRITPPELTGSGAILPAVVIAVGQLGLEVLQQFRQQVTERFGTLDRIPSLKVVFIDTDQDTLQQATESSFATSLVPGEIVPMRLNRAGHYLKPRRNGRSLIEGWFDPQLLYKIPRNPMTLGIRSLGRLAFCDHYRTFATKFREDIESCTHPDSLAQADRNTMLGFRTNRPRVYIIAGLAGGTGGGMFLDVAYAARHRLKLLGYTDPEVYGILILPSMDRTAHKPYALSNTYASLRELNHYCMPETVYTASHDDRDAQIHDPGRPFKEFFLFTLKPAGNKGVTGPDGTTRKVASFLRRELLTPMGRVNDTYRGPTEDHSAADVVGHVIGQQSYTWPREVILSQTSRWLGETLISRWLKTEAKLLREHVKSWLNDRWNAEELGPEPMIAALQKAAEKQMGQSPENVFAAEAQPFVPRGWFARDPDPAKLWQTLTRLQQLVGMPDERSMQRQVGQLEHTLNDCADQIARDLSPKVGKLSMTLLEHPDYRVVGSEEAIQQLHALLDQLLHHYEPLAMEMSSKAVDAFYVIHGFLTNEFSRRKPSPAEIAENLRLYPKWRFQSLILRQVCRIYLTLKGQLGDQLREIQFCRQRLEDVISRIRHMTGEFPPEQENLLLPAGCQSIEKAIQALRESIKPEDLRMLDKKFQKHIEQEYQALHSVCLSSVNMLGNLQTIVTEQSRQFLSAKLGEVSVAGMFFARYPEARTATLALKKAYDEAAPPGVSPTLAVAEACILGVPSLEQSNDFHQIMAHITGEDEIELAVSQDEIVVHREQTRLPLTSVPQSGPLAEDAYTAAQGGGQNPPHSRIDVGQWFDIEDSH